MLGHLLCSSSKEGKKMWPILEGGRNCGLRSGPNLFLGNTNLIKISSSQMFSELKKQTIPQDLIDRDIT